MIAWCFRRVSSHSTVARSTARKCGGTIREETASRSQSRYNRFMTKTHASHFSNAIAYRGTPRRTSSTTYSALAYTRRCCFPRSTGRPRTLNGFGSTKRNRNRRLVTNKSLQTPVELARLLGPIPSPKHLSCIPGALEFFSLANINSMASPFLHCLIEVARGWKTQTWSTRSNPCSFSSRGARRRGVEDSFRRCAMSDGELSLHFSSVLRSWAACSGGKPMRTIRPKRTMVQLMQRRVPRHLRPRVGKVVPTPKRLLFICSKNSRSPFLYQP